MLYPKNRQPYLFNLVGSHDTSRIMTIANERVERVMQAFALLFTFAGSPCVLYGDEVGLTGEGMDKARRCMVWEEEKQNGELKAFVKKMIKLREIYPEMKSTDMRFLHANEDGLVYAKGKLIVLLNNRNKSTTLPLPVKWAGNNAKDLLTGDIFSIKKTTRLSPYGLGIWELL